MYFRGSNTEQFGLCHEQSCQILFFLHLYCEKELSTLPPLQQQVQSSIFFLFSLLVVGAAPEAPAAPKPLGVDSEQVPDSDFPYTGQPLPGSEFALKM